MDWLCNMFTAHVSCNFLTRIYAVLCQPSNMNRTPQVIRHIPMSVDAKEQNKKRKKQITCLSSFGLICLSHLNAHEI